MFSPRTGPRRPRVRARRPGLARCHAPPAEKPATLPDVVDPWWASELLRRRAELVGFLEARAGVSNAVAHEIVDGLGTELVERFKDRRLYPVAWFREDVPEPRIAAAFHELLRTIALRRSYDHLRSEYRQRKLRPVLEEHLREDGRPTVERLVDARRLLAVLAAELEKLLPDERELLLKGDRLQNEPLSGRERIRLYRLRRRLTSAVKKELLR